MEQRLEDLNDLIDEEVENELEKDVEETLDMDSFKDTSAFSLDLSVETLSILFQKEQFVFDPDFQRRKVWDDVRKSRFIESMILNLPIPSLLVAKDDEKDQYIIIDGKQRLSAIRDFISPDNFGNGYKLKGLEVLKELNGLTYAALQKDKNMITYLSRFSSYPIKTNIVRNYDDKKLYFIFARLNSGSVPLSTQELRHTLFPGEFSKFINIESEKNKTIRRILKLKPGKVDLRMRDAELLCRYFAFKYFLSNYNDTVGSILDYAYKEINSNWEEYKERVSADLIEFDKSAELIYSIFGDNAFKKYSPKEEVYFNFNRLVFDILTVLFSKQENRNRVFGKEREFEGFYKELFNDDYFAEAFMPTTSTQAKTFARFEILQNKFDEAF